MSESIYDLIINKCHFIGLLPQMALNLEYVVYESCQFDDLTIKKFKQNFFVENFQVLANFLS